MAEMSLPCARRTCRSGCDLVGPTKYAWPRYRRDARTGAALERVHTALLVALSGGGAVGIVTGPLDDHCSGVTPIVVSESSCHPSVDAGAPADVDGGAADDAGAEPEP